MTAPRNMGEQIRFQKRTPVRAAFGLLMILISVEYFFVWILLAVKRQTDWGGLLLFLEVVTVAIVFVRLIFSSRERHSESGDTHLPAGVAGPALSRFLPRACPSCCCSTSASHIPRTHWRTSSLCPRDHWGISSRCSSGRSSSFQSASGFPRGAGNPSPTHKRKWNFASRGEPTVGAPPDHS